jgi:hypothetical protein
MRASITGASQVSDVLFKARAAEADSSLQKLRPKPDIFPMERLKMLTSAPRPISSQIALMELMLLVRCASIALATGLDSSLLKVLTVTMRSLGTKQRKLP